MCKKRYTNSVMFQAASYKMAASIGMSDGRTFKKYLEYAKALELVSHQDNTYTFIKWTEAVVMTLQIHPKQAQYFDKPFAGFNKFKEFQYYIESSLIGLNFKSQDHNIRSKFNKDKIHPEHTPDKKEVNAWYAQKLLQVALKAKKANEAGLPFNPSNVLTMNERKNKKYPKKDSQRTKHIITGSIHTGKIIGRSHSTAMRRLKLLSDNGFIQYKDIVNFKDCLINDDSIAAMNETKKKGGLILPTNTGYKEVYGKRILSFKLGLFQVGTKCVQE